MNAKTVGAHKGGDGSAAQRQTLLDAELERLTELLKAAGATLVVVFGSYARGGVRAHSDLDMLAVVESDEPFIARSTRLYQSLVPRVALDLLVYTPAELDRIRDRPFIRQALDERMVLHGS